MRTVQGHFADRLFFSVKGIAANGMLTDADPLEAELKRTMIEQAGESVLLIDQSKLSVRGLSVIAPIAEVDDDVATGLDDARGGRAAARRHDGSPGGLAHHGSGPASRAARVAATSAVKRWNSASSISTLVRVVPRLSSPSSSIPIARFVPALAVRALHLEPDHVDVHAVLVVGAVGEDLEHPPVHAQEQVIDPHLVDHVRRPFVSSGVEASAAASAVRVRTPSFTNAPARWLSIVFSLRNNASATARLVMPPATSWAISSSRAVSAAEPAASARPARPGPVDAAADPAQLAHRLRPQVPGRRVDEQAFGGAQLLGRGVAVAGRGERAPREDAPARGLDGEPERVGGRDGLEGERHRAGRRRPPRGHERARPLRERARERAAPPRLRRAVAQAAAPGVARQQRGAGEHLVAPGALAGEEAREVRAALQLEQDARRARALAGGDERRGQGRAARGGDRRRFEAGGQRDRLLARAHRGGRVSARLQHGGSNM